MPCYALSSFYAHWQMKSKLQLAKGNCGNFCNFWWNRKLFTNRQGIWGSCCMTSCWHYNSSSRLDTCVNVIGLFERRFKDFRSFKGFCFVFVWHLEKYGKQNALFHSPWGKKNKVNAVVISLKSLLNHSDKKHEFCSVHQYPRGTTCFKTL